MAMPSHSPPQYGPNRSPPRLMNGHSDHYNPSPYGPPRPMLPPSPHYQPRYHVTPGPTQSQPSVYDSRPPPPPLPGLPPPHKRPGSSMSISSMLDAQPERHVERHSSDPHSNHTSHPPRPASTSTSAMPMSVMMSSPQPPSRLPLYDPSLKPDPMHVDRFNSYSSATRPRSISSGAHVSQDRPPYDYRPSPNMYNNTSHLLNTAPPAHEGDYRKERRGSLNGILQRPNSQPLTAAPPVQPPLSYSQPQSRHNWSFDPPSQKSEPPPRPAFSAYDTRPPAPSEPPRTLPPAQPSPQMHSSSASPELRRITANVSNRFSGLFNQPTSHPMEAGHVSSQSMTRQDSAASFSDRSANGGRGLRHYSPFAASFNSTSGSLIDERKNSDEISHKAIVGLGLENRRGRYSPVPQAVQGAQASPGPNGGVKNEQGRVFSGIGGGLGTTPTPQPPFASPFKKEATLARINDENSTKMSRVSSTAGQKRSRKAHDDESRTNGEANEGKKTGAKNGKRAKVQNSYKADLEEMNGSTYQPRNSAVSTLASTRRGGTPSSIGPTSAPSSQRYDTAPIFKPRKTVKVATVMNQTLKKPRRHLGTFTYDPEISVPEKPAPGDPDFDVAIKPNVLPSFAAAEDLNCVYTIRVSRMWLKDKERRLVCSSRNLWGTGIYTDDSDPVAAAMHMGWIRPGFNANVDEVLLGRVVDEQNPKVEVSKEFKPPSKPIAIKEGQDLKITLVVMPQLENYAQSARCGLSSRAWPATPESSAPHDGVSFAILKVEAVEVGIEERRLGRTGESKRKRLRAQLGARCRAIGARGSNARPVAAIATA